MAPEPINGFTRLADKERFHQLGQDILKQLRKELGCPKADVRSNRAGPGVGGEVSMATPWIYVWPRGWKVWGDSERKYWMEKQNAQACRERWRAVLLLTKAKLEAVRLGLSTVEKEFLSDLVLQDGRTAYQAMGAQIQKALTNHRPLMLGDGT